MKLKTTDNEKARFLLFLSFKHFHEANRCDQHSEPGDCQAVTIHRVVRPLPLWDRWGLPNEGILQGHGPPFYPESPRRVHRYGNQKDKAHCRNRSLGVVHLSGYHMDPREMNQGMPLQGSDRGCQMGNGRSERISCEPGIHPLTGYGRQVVEQLSIETASRLDSQLAPEQI